jgi:hypothetical protein
MHKIVQFTIAIGLALAPVLSSPPAEAGVPHTWVASTGSDSNNCDRPTPCATLDGAYSKTNAGGEITCVDSGNFGGLVITDSITVNCENAIASALGGAGIGNFLVTTNSPSVVVLRGLDLDGANSGCGNITSFGSGALHIEKVKVNQNANSCNGISFVPAGPAKLFISDSDITNNGSLGTAAGIYVAPAFGVKADIVIDRTHIEGNYFGIIADGNNGGIINGVIRDSVVSGNTQNGITASTMSSNVVLLIDNTTVSGNFHGLVAGGSTAAMMVRNTSVIGNNVGLFTINGGALYSYLNNSVDANSGNSGAFTGTVPLK